MNVYSGGFSAMKRSLENSFHTQPLFYTAIFFIVGIVLSFYFPVEKDWPVLAVLAVLLLLVVIIKNMTAVTVILLLLLIALGYERGMISLYRQEAGQPSAAQVLNSAALSGTVTERTERKNGRVQVLFETDSILTGGSWKQARVKIRITDKSARLKHIGQHVRIFKPPSPLPMAANPGMFNARYYYDMHEIPFRLTLNSRDSLCVPPGDTLPRRSLIRQARMAVSRMLDRYLHPQASAFMQALLLGRKQNIDREIINNFQQTGIIHVLAISGLHVGFIVLFLYTLLSLLQIPETFRLIITVVALALFAAMVEFKAPVMRASLMIVLYMLAKKIHRPVKPLQLLGLAALLLVIYNPRELFLPGFQFSFAAVWGLLYGTKRVEPLIPRINGKSPLIHFLNNYVRQPFVASLCAVLATTPLTWYYYGVIQVGAIFFNIAVIPLVGLIVLLGIFLLIAASLPFMPAVGIATILNLLISGFNTLVTHAAHWPVFQIHAGRASWTMMVLLMIFITSAFHAAKRRWRYLALAALGLLIFPYGLLNLSPPPLRVTFLDVGQGDACLIEFPNGKKMLLDAGDAGFGFSAGSWYIEPFLKYRGIRHLDYALISHPHADHMGGFDYLFDKIRVDTLILNELAVGSALYKNLLQKARRRKIVIKHWQRGLRRRMGGTALYVLHPRDADEHVKEPHGREINDSSIVFKLQYGQTAFLFTGDAELPAEKAMLGFGDFLNSDVLKVGHHGSSTSTGEGFLSLVSPRLAVVSVGAKNKFRHPSPENLRRLARKGTRILRTDRLGAIIITSDGREIRLERWR